MSALLAMCIDRSVDLVLHFRNRLTTLQGSGHDVLFLTAEVVSPLLKDTGMGMTAGGLEHKEVSSGCGFREAPGGA